MKIRIRNTRFQLLFIIAIAIIIRIVLICMSADLPLTISDEKEYNQIALNIANGEGFSLNQTQTAVRPPLYPAFIAFVYHLTNSTEINDVRIAQLIVSICNILLIYFIGKEVFDRKTGILSAFIFSLYPTFLGFNVFLLSEILFTLLLCLLCYFLILFFKDKNWIFLILGGISLGLSSLTRSFIWGFVFLTAAFLLLLRRGKFKLQEKTISIILLFLSFSCVVAPWSIRNYRTFHSFVLINSTPGAQFYIGNSKYTNPDRSWEYNPQTIEDWRLSYVDYCRKHKIACTEAVKNRVGFMKGMQFIRENPLLTLKRDFIKIFDFWGNERTILAGMAKGWFGPQNKWAFFLIGASIVLSYMPLVLAGVFGMIFGYKENKVLNRLFLLLIFYVTVIHALVHGHPRYHLPLIPIITIYASYAFLRIKDIWRLRKKAKFVLSVVICSVFIFIWIRQFVLYYFYGV